MTARILKIDKFQKGEDVMVCKYASAKEAKIGILQSLFGNSHWRLKMSDKLGYSPKWLPKHTIRVKKALKSKPIPCTILDAILKI